MSYNLRGSITIKPPLNFAEIKTAREVALKMLLSKSYAAKHATPENVFENYPLMLQIEEFQRETDEGTLTVKQAEFLRPSYSSNAKLSYDMAELVVALIKALPGHNWKGTVTALHEEMTGGEKVVVDAWGSGAPVQDTVRTVKGTVYLRWEDDSSEEEVADLL